MSDYVLAWMVYLLAAAGAVWVLCRLLRALRLPALRWPLGLFCLGLLLTPVGVPDQAAWYAPAVVVAAVQLLDDGTAALLQGLLRPVQTGLLLTVLGLLGMLVHRRWSKRQARPASDSPMAMDDTHEV